jgi:hypothetical protein
MISKYLADKGIIDQKNVIPLGRPDINNAFNPAPNEEQEAGDLLTQMISGGLNFPGAPKAVGKLGVATAKAGQETASAIKNAPKNVAESMKEGLPGKFYRGVSNERTGDVMAKGYAKDLETSQGLYNKAFENAKAKGVEKIPHDITQADLDILKGHLDEDFADSLRKAMESGSIEDLHTAQSELKKHARSMKRKAKSNPDLSQAAKDSGKKARELSEKINNSITRELLEKGGMDLLFDYVGAGHHFKEHVVPWNKLESIRGTQLQPGMEDFRFPYNLPVEARAKKANSFLSGKGKQFPELMINQMVHSPLGALIEALMGVGALGKVAKE